MTEEELDELLARTSANLIEELNRVIDVPARLAELFKEVDDEREEES